MSEWRYSEDEEADDGDDMIVFDIDFTEMTDQDEEGQPMRYHLNDNEVDTIREALYKRIEADDENVATMTEIAAQLRAGQPVPPFPLSEKGAEIADGMVQNFQNRQAKCRALLDKQFAYPTEEDE